LHDSRHLYLIGVDRLKEPTHWKFPKTTRSPQPASQPTLARFAASVVVNTDESPARIMAGHQKLVIRLGADWQPTSTLYQTHLPLATVLTHSPMPTTTAIQKFESAMRQYPIGDFTVLVAVSGGADSVFLLRALRDWQEKQTGVGRLIVAHVNHGLRGSASQADEQFVRELCQSLRVPLLVRKVGGSGGREKGDSEILGDCESHRGQGLESLLRTQRYAAFQQVAEEQGARYVFTGHHRNDQVETVLFRIFRGTGIDGPRGIPATRKLTPALSVVRPMLDISKQEILDQLARYNQDFRMDDSNADDRVTRNQIRHSILPLVRDSFGNDIDQAIAGLRERSIRLGQTLQELSKPILDQHFRSHPGSIEVLGDNLDHWHPELILIACRHAWLQAGFPTQDMTDKKWTQLVEVLCCSSSPKTVAPMFPGKVSIQETAGGYRLNRGDLTTPN